MLKLLNSFKHSLLLILMDEKETAKTVKRTKCPYLGFSYIANLKAFVDNQDNRCGLLSAFGKYEPCPWARGRIEPDLTTCETPRHVKAMNYQPLQAASKVYPLELRLPNSDLRGVPFKDWQDYILNGTPLPAHESA